MNFTIEITADRILFGLAFQNFVDDKGEGRELSIGLFFIILNFAFYETN